MSRLFNIRKNVASSNIRTLIPSFPPEVKATPENLVPPPTVGGALGYLEPQTINHGAKTFRYTRIGDATVFGGDDYRVRNSYPKNQSWNADGTLLKTSTSNRKVIEGYNRFRVLPYPSGIGQRWSHIDPHKLFGAYDNIFYISTINPTTRAIQSYDEVRTFSDYTIMNFGSDENNFDNNDTYCVLIGRKAANTNTWLLVYNIQTDTIVAELDLGVGVPYGSVLDYATMSQDGNFVLVNYFTDGNGAHQGVKVYNNDLTNLTHLIDYSEHGDVGVDQSGNQVYVSYDYTSVPGYALSMVRLDNGALTGLFPTGMNLQGGHVSCRNILRPGWAYVNPQGSLGNAGQRLFAVKLDDTETIENWGYTFNNNINSDHSSLACPSPDGRQVIFSSNWSDASLESLNVAPAFVMSL